MDEKNETERSIKDRKKNITNLDVKRSTNRNVKKKNAVVRKIEVVENLEIQYLYFRKWSINQH
jgi:hypothetical protein